MKRESRLQGMPRSSAISPSPWNPRPKTKVVNKIDCPSAAGSYQKESSKPANHSKYTPWCDRPRWAEFHTHPASKSKDKNKGAHKLRLRDVVDKEAGDNGHGLKYAGISAAGILGLLARDRWDDDDEDDDAEDDVEEDYDGSVALQDGLAPYVEKAEEIRSRMIENEDDEDDGMSFVLCLEQEDVDEEEGWCIVGEM